jgi:hypothetical protein
MRTSSRETATTRVCRLGAPLAPAQCSNGRHVKEGGRGRSLLTLPPADDEGRRDALCSALRRHVPGSQAQQVPPARHLLLHRACALPAPFNTWHSRSHPVLISSSQLGVVCVGTSSYMSGAGSVVQTVTPEQNLCGLALIIISQVRARFECLFTSKNWVRAAPAHTFFTLRVGSCTRPGVGLSIKRPSACSLLLLRLLNLQTGPSR